MELRYKITNCIRSIKQYIEYLPELEINEGYNFMLLYRGKYGKTHKGEVNLKSFFTNNKKYILENILQLNSVDGSYNINNEPVDPNSLVLYTKPNPRSLKMASVNGMSGLNSNLGLANQNELFNSRKIKQIITDLLVDFDTNSLDDVNKDLKNILNLQNKINNHKFKLPNKIIENSLNESPSRKITFTLDFDFKNDILTFGELYKILKNTFDNLSCIRGIIKTRGGFHVHVFSETLDKKNWFFNLKEQLPSFVELEINKDVMSPVPGTIQGGVEPILMFSNTENVEFMTSEAWSEVLDIFILDPDGWDRSDYQWSFNRELITILEYNKRCYYSTTKI